MCLVCSFPVYQLTLSQGLVIVLHGPPGVGKTLTAETVAEHARKCLYPLNIGDMSGDRDVAQRLQDAFETAARWDAVLLLDEADVLLERRSYEDVRRNSIVSSKILIALLDVSNVFQPFSGCWNITKEYSSSPPIGSRPWTLLFSPEFI